MDLLLIGRTGNGKSSTGNNILGSDRFKKNNDSYAKSSRPTSGGRVYRDQRVTVVDGLCLQEDSFKDCVRDALEALRLGNDGFTALVFILRYGEKFGADEIELVTLAKRVFGKDVVKDHGICVVTRGDDFKYAVDEREESVRNFYEWRRKQTGDLKNLFHECQDRTVLFDNKTKDENEREKQLLELLEIVSGIQNGPVKRYTVDNFSQIHGKLVVSEVESKSTEFETKTRDKIREIEEKVVVSLKYGIPNEKLQKSLHEELMELSMSVNLTMDDGEQKLMFIQQMQDLCDKIKMKRPRSHHDLDKSEAHNAREAQSHDACKMSQQHVDKGNGQNLQLLLLGRTGNGKSSTGNSILGRQAFKPSASMSSATTEVLSDSETIDGQLITVIDGPGLDDTEKTSEEDFMASLSSVERALDLCDYGFSAILVVLRFGFRFTNQERDAIRVVRSILGKHVLTKYGVCLMTHGDNFNYEMTQNVEEGEAVSFREWCEAQTGDIKQLFKECEFRHVLFDNKTRDANKMAQQRKELLSMIPPGVCYSKQEFVDSERDLAEVNLDFILPKLEQKTNAKLEKFRDSLKTIDINCKTDEGEFFKQMQSMLAEILEFKEAIVLLGQHKATEFFIMQLDALEAEVNTKIKLRSQSRDMKSLEGTTASQTRPGTVSAPQGSTRQYDPGNARWSSETQYSAMSQWTTPYFGSDASQYMAPSHSQGGSRSAVPIEAYGPVSTYPASGDVSRSEVSDVINGTKQHLQRIRNKFVSAQRKTNLEWRKREIQSVLGELIKLKETLEEIAKESSCYSDIKREIGEAEDEMKMWAGQCGLHRLVYPESDAQRTRREHNELTAEGFVVINNPTYATVHHDQSIPVARRSYPKKENIIKAIKSAVQKKWTAARKFIKHLIHTE